MHMSCQRKNFLSKQTPESSTSERSTHGLIRTFQQCRQASVSSYSIAQSNPLSNLLLALSRVCRTSCPCGAPFCSQSVDSARLLTGRELLTRVASISRRVIRRETLLPEVRSRSSHAVLGAPNEILDLSI
jgi:hypothetical protein